MEPRAPDWLQRPELSQPLVTALQLVMLDIFSSWSVYGNGLVGHSSGEIAAAVAAGYLTPEEAIKIAYYRGKAASDLRETCNYPVGMLAVGLGIEDVRRYISEADLVEVACINSPKSVTLSGSLAQLKELMTRIQDDSYFARLLRVDLAYHSSFMRPIATHYQELLIQNCGLPLAGNKSAAMFSSVTGQHMEQACDASYWMKNMTSPVLFSQAVQQMVLQPGGPDFLIEIGPSGALAGPISQIKEALTAKGVQLEYIAASKRGPDSARAFLDVAGLMYVSGIPINLSNVNEDSEPNHPSIIVDLPNYSWNHSIKHYWHESESSKEWRFRRFPHHDLLGSKVLGTSWNVPSFSKVLRVQDLSWLKDHRVSVALGSLNSIWLTYVISHSLAVILFFLLQVIWPWLWRPFTRRVFPQAGLTRRSRTMRFATGFVMSNLRGPWYWKNKIPATRPCCLLCNVMGQRTLGTSSGSYL